MGTRTVSLIGRALTIRDREESSVGTVPLQILDNDGRA